MDVAPDGPFPGRKVRLQPVVAVGAPHIGAIPVNLDCRKPRSALDYFRQIGHVLLVDGFTALRATIYPYRLDE
jgi:hypothetical protein